MAKQQLKTRSTSTSSKQQTSTHRNTKERNAPSREKDQKPEFGVENQRWLSDIGGPVFVCANPYPVKRMVNGKWMSDKAVYGEGNPTIFQSEATGDLTRDSIRFKNRVLTASKDNPLLQEYLWTITQLGGYKDIKLEDKEKEAEQELEAFELEDRNAEIIMKSGLMYKKAVYRAMGGVLEPSANDRAVTARLRKMNRENPQKLSQALHKETVEVDYVCEQVIQKGYVEQEGDKVYWLGKGKTTKNLITNTVAGRFNHTVLSDLMASDDEFKAKWLQLFTEALEQE